MTPQQQLIHRFKKQHEFSRSSSPLVSRQCQLFSEWLEKGRQPFTNWLLDSTHGRPSFEVPMLLNAGLHYLVLINSPSVDCIRRFYPGAGGESSPGDPEFAALTGQAVSAAAGELQMFIKTTRVQTNESSRGLCWLLPVLYTPWQRIDLLELGASAGLNLVADERSYRLVEEGSGRVMCRAGSAVEDQFKVMIQGVVTPPPGLRQFEVASRAGCDLEPFFLDKRAAQQLLTSFIWADQIWRTRRLNEGIEALMRLRRKGKGPVLERAVLPEQFSEFVLAHDRDPAGPLVLFHTYVTKYLKKKAEELDQNINEWALQRSHETLRVQMELPPSGRKPPHLGWLLWQLGYYRKGRKQTFELAWVHPHCSRLKWLPGMADWVRFWAAGQQGAGCR